MSGEKQQTFDFGEIKRRSMASRGERRMEAMRQYERAAIFARSRGFELIRHTEAHYKVRTPWWDLEIYPSTYRLYNHPDNPAPILKKNLPENWTLLDVVHAVAQAIKDKPKPEQPLGQETTPAMTDRVSQARLDFKKASMFASAHGFFFYKSGDMYRVKGPHWELLVDPAKHTITRVDDKGPHLEKSSELGEDWRLLDVVKAVQDRLEAHNVRLRPK